MSKKSSISLLLILLSQPHLLHAWGGGDKLSDGSCKFDKEIGYTGSSFYIKGNEGFVIVNGGDSRYGTTSTIYDATTCKKITSGDTYKSQFGNLFSRKGFENISIDSNKLMDREFKSLVTSSENNDNMSIKLTPISSSITSKLNALLMPLSDKSASSSISVSDEIQTLIQNEGFIDAFDSKINELNADNINFNYALALNSKIDKNIKSNILNKYFHLNVHNISDIPKWIENMNKLGEQNSISNFSSNIIGLSGFGKNLTFDNFFNSIEYNSALKYIKPKVEDLHQNSTYTINIQYPNKTITLSENSSCSKTGSRSYEGGCGLFWANSCKFFEDNYSCYVDKTKFQNFVNRLNVGK